MDIVRDRIQCKRDNSKQGANPGMTTWMEEYSWPQDTTVWDLEVEQKDDETEKGHVEREIEQYISHDEEQNQ